MPSLSIVIVTLNRRAEVLALLSDLIRQPGRPGDEVIVVDNGSADGTSATVRQTFPQVKLRRMETNRGAPAARNAGVKQARGEIVIFLDDDTRVEDPGFLDAVRAAFQRHPEMGLAAFRILDPASRRQRPFEIPRRDKTEPTAPFETSYFIAAGCAVRRVLYLQAGGMDEELMYGFEELDLGYRAVAAGGRIFFRPEITVLHGLSAAGRARGRQVYYFCRNKIWISARYLPWHMVCSQIVAWTLFGLRESLRIGRPDVLVRALGAGFAGVYRRRHLRRRDRLAAATLQRLRTIEGRLYR